MRSFKFSSQVICCFFAFFQLQSAVFSQTASPPHTSWTEIFKGNGDEGIVCYKEKHRNFFFITFGLVALLAGVTLNQYKIKRRSADALKEKNRTIEEKNKDIVDSINYAERIQQAILPDANAIASLLPESFIYYQPKDIVSGDFYWIAEKEGHIIVAVADSTGHGVPGAFMSMLGNAFLNEIVLEKGVTEPGLILNHLRDKIIRALKQGDSSESRDGMDIALVSIRKENGEYQVQYAGANNPLWVFRKEGITEIKGDKQPVGVRTGEQISFTNHHLKLEAGTLIYLFSDGFADQFGGASGKKFRYKPLQKLISDMMDRPLAIQKEVLARTIHDWKGGLEQVDDMLIMGIRL
jgi:serine phosphatase RsbU (regulator of sigma subunit)